MLDAFDIAETSLLSSLNCCEYGILSRMVEVDVNAVVALTRQLVDIESITGNEGPVGNFLCDELLRRGFQSTRIPVEGERCNVFAVSPEESRPAVVFSTHMDTVPPFISSSEDATRVYGRGSCDAKGIIATQVAAAERAKRCGMMCPRPIRFRPQCGHHDRSPLTAR